jgi:ketosteroid isomerase-like protein
MKTIQKTAMVIAVIVIVSFSAQLQAQSPKGNKMKGSEGSVEEDIRASLESWNQAAKNRDLDKFMAQFDDTPEIMLIGSDSGEIFKGKAQIKKWLKSLFGFASFSWEMDRIDIDHFENTAWVFMEGYMVVTNEKGSAGRAPYRFTGILVKKDNEWKWRLFNGSVPEGE